MSHPIPSDSAAKMGKPGQAIPWTKVFIFHGDEAERCSSLWRSHMQHPGWGINSTLQHEDGTKEEEESKVVSDFFPQILEYLKAASPNTTLYVEASATAYGADRQSITLDELESVWKTSPQCYVKDWHIVLELGEQVAQGLYSTPPVFADDWLNWFWDRRNRLIENFDLEHAVLCPHKKLNDDYRFIYFGKKGSRTALHHDVMGSNSWSANVVGTKFWTLVPREYRQLLEEAGITSFADPFTAALVDELGKHPCGRGEAIKELVEQHQPGFAFALVLPHSTTACFEYGYDPLTKELTKPPEGGEALQDEVASVKDPRLVPRIFLVQPKGSAIYVPSLWYHEVANLEETLSINHNWFHAPVLPSITAFLLEEWRAVKEAIADTRNEELEFDAEWEGQCQLVMGADCGMNIVEFCLLLTAKLREQVEAFTMMKSEEYGDVQFCGKVKEASPLTACSIPLPQAACKETIHQIVATLEELLQHEFVSQVLSKSSATFDAVLLEKAKELMMQGSGK